MANPILEVEGALPDALSEAIFTSTAPLVLRGLTAAWPAVQAALTSQPAGASYLRRFYRGAPVRAMLGPPDIAGRFFYNDDFSGFNFRPVDARLDDILAELETQRDAAEPAAVYVGATTLDTCLPGFRDENRLDLGARDALASIWIGNRTRIPAHHDLPDNIACVAAGRRRFTLLPPEQLSNLYVGPLDFTLAGQAISLVDFSKPDLQKFPKFAEAMRHAQIAELGPGDAIFIPSMWWHQIEALDSFNVLVNYWWRQSPSFMDTPMTALMLALMTMRDLPREQRSAWKEMFRHYVFDSDGSEAEHIPPAARGMLAPFDIDASRAMRGQILRKLNR